MDPNQHLPVRKMVTIDDVPFRLLGWEPDEMTSPCFRTLFGELGQMLEEASQSLKLILDDDDWGDLLHAAQTEGGRKIMASNTSPAGKLLYLNGLAGLDSSVLEGLNAGQRVAVLSAIRWGMRHPDGRWWETGTRLGVE